MTRSTSADPTTDVAARLEGLSYSGHVRFEVLGRLRVVDADHCSAAAGTGLRLGGARQQLVLAMLLAEANNVVSTDSLVDGLWDGSPPSAARHTVQGYVSELRKLVGPVIERDGAGYVLRVDEGELDALEFEALVQQGRSRLVDDPDGAVDLLRAALALWRGAPYDGLDDPGVLLTERIRLEELHLLALEDRITADLALGRHREVVAELDGLSSEHPYRERLRAQHMLALYRDGRQAEALRAFQRTRRVLVEELGIEPSPVLRQLEEQILVQDPALDLPTDPSRESAVSPGSLHNPYKGLRAFTEADAETFYGRDQLIAQLSSALEESGLVAVVGPSGSGKSSLVQAGLIPALRASSGGTWVVAVMRPGAYPFTELEAAIARAVDEPHLPTIIPTDEADVLRAVLGTLPDDASRLLLVVDQFEELFALVGDEQRDCFLRSLIALATDPRGRSRVLVALRADFYDRPLMHPAFGRLMTGRVVNVLPLAPEDLESAALGPAAEAGVSFERGLLAALIDEVSGQPNALPLFQYTLTELFDHREDSTLTRSAYVELGGIRGAVARRAEEIFAGLEDEQREATRQLFLRLVTVGRDADTRRVVLVSELITLDVDVVTMHGAIDAFVTNRLLVRDRDAMSGALTLEVTHEALLSEWERLRQWIDEARDDLRQHTAYVVAVDDWLTSGRDPEYLLAGTRLEQFEQWGAVTTMRLTASEREFLDEARRRRDAANAAEIERVAEQAHLRRRARRGSFALGALVAAGVAGVIGALLAAGGSRPTAQIAVIVSSDSAEAEQTALYEQGVVRAERDFDLDIERRSGENGAQLPSNDGDLVVMDAEAARSVSPDDLDPDTRYVFTDDDGRRFEGLPNVTTYGWAQEQAGFLAGVAAATTTRTGTVAMLGAVRPADGQDEHRAGFEAGARSIRPDITLLSAYLADFGYDSAPYDEPEGAREVAGRLYDSRADVIFHVAGRSGVGVVEAASGLSPNKRWTIGVGSDLWQGATTRQRPQILMSIVHRFDAQMYGIIEDYLDAGLEAGSHRFTVADDMISYATVGDVFSSEARLNVDRAIRDLASGEVEPPRVPTGSVTDADAWLEPGAESSLLGDVPVTFTVPDGWSTSVEGAVLKGEPEYGVMFWGPFTRTYTDSCPSRMIDPPPGPTVEDFAAAWADMPAFEATTPTDISVDGFVGKLVEFTVPDYDEAECPYGDFMLLGADPGDTYWAQAPNGHHQLRILEVNGTRQMITAFWYPDTPAEDRASIQQILDSVQIG